MHKHYRLRVKTCDPALQLQLPDNMLDDLRRIACENGRDLNTEFLVRISRTLQSLEDDKHDENNFLSYLFSGDHDDELFFAKGA